MKLEPSKFVDSASKMLEKYKHLSKAVDTMNPDDMKNRMNDLCSYVSDLSMSMQYLSNDMTRLYENANRHMDGHLPPLKGAGNMKKALKALGMEDDYSVQSPTIYASVDGKKSVILDLVK